MATPTNEQIEAQKQQLNQSAEKAVDLSNEQVGAGEMELSEDELDKAAGGVIDVQPIINRLNPDLPPPDPDLPGDPLDYPTLV